MEKLQTEITTRLNLDTEREEQICKIIINGKIVYSYKVEIINRKVKLINDKDTRSILPPLRE